MDTVRKFNFGESFLDSAGHIVNPDIERARDQGKKIGYDEGYNQAKSELEADVLAMVTVLNTRLSEIREAQKEAYEFVTSSTVMLTRAIFRKLLPYMMTKYGDDEVSSFVDEVLKALKPTGQVTIVVNSALLKAVEARVHERLAHHEGHLKLTVKADDSVERADCRVHWDDGGIEHIKAQLLKQVGEALDRVLANVPKEPGMVEEENTTVENTTTEEETTTGETNV